MGAIKYKSDGIFHLVITSLQRETSLPYNCIIRTYLSV